jgi:hypothetical protein
MRETFPRILMLLVLVCIPFSAHAAQSDKSKVSKPPPAKGEPVTWLLAGREGECTSLSILSKKGPEFSDVKSPYQLAETLEATGHKAEIKEFKAATRPAVEVRAPSAGLYVMFVKKEFCDKPVPPAPEKK